MNNQAFMDIIPVPLDNEETVNGLISKLEEARKIGAANELDEVLTTFSRKVDDYNNNRIIFDTNVALFPKPSLINCEIFKNYKRLFSGPYLSELSHVYSGKDINQPERVLVHVRSKKMFQGNEQVSVSHAGYVKYGEHPAETAKREFNEELKKFNDVEPIFVEDEGYGLKEADETPKCLDCTMHYMGNNRIRNPVLGFVQYVEPRIADRYPTVNSLNELNNFCTDTKDFEVLGTAWIPFNNLRQFWSEVARADRVYSISHESTENLMTCFDKLAK